jgi:hypothetical protein
MGLAADQRRSFPKRHSWSPHPDRFWAPPNILSNGPQGLFPKGKGAGGNIPTADHRTVAPNLKTPCSHYILLLEQFRGRVIN